MRKMKADSLPELVRMAVQLRLASARKRSRNVLGGTEHTMWLTGRGSKGISPLNQMRANDLSLWRMVVALAVMNHGKP